MYLMIDLETLSTRVDAVVTQLGYCIFEPGPNAIYFSNEIHLDPEEQILMGRKVDWKTLQWWHKQNAEAKENMFGEGGQALTVEQALAILHQDIDLQYGWKNIEGVWSNGLLFDIAIMETLYDAIGQKFPWNFRACRDTRTLFMLVPEMEFQKPEIAHSAMQDAISQAKNVINAMQIISSALSEQ